MFEYNLISYQILLFGQAVEELVSKVQVGLECRNVNCAAQGLPYLLEVLGAEVEVSILY